MKKFLVAIVITYLITGCATTYHQENLFGGYSDQKFEQDVYQVCKELCHSSVTITEKYANFFSFEELEDDFKALKDGSSFLDFMRRVPPPSDKSSIPLMEVLGAVGVTKLWVTIGMVSLENNPLNFRGLSKPQ